MNRFSPPSRQQVRIQDTRHAILDSAVALYQTQGVDNTRVSAIIQRSGLGRTTFYRYFKDGDDVLNQAVLRDFDAVMADFADQRHEHADLATQIVEDMIWFIRQLRRRPALRLLYSGNSRQLYERVNVAIAASAQAALACVRPNFERAKRLGLLRPGVTLEKYVSWCTFVAMSLLTVIFPAAEDETRLRAMLMDFFVPSLIVIASDQPQEQEAAELHALMAGGSS